MTVAALVVLARRTVRRSDRFRLRRLRFARFALAGHRWLLHLLLVVIVVAVVGIVVGRLHDRLLLVAVVMADFLRLVGNLIVGGRWAHRFLCDLRRLIVEPFVQHVCEGWCDRARIIIGVQIVRLRCLWLFLLLRLRRILVVMNGRCGGGDGGSFRLLVLLSFGLCRLHWSRMLLLLVVRAAFVFVRSIRQRLLLVIMHFLLNWCDRSLSVRYCGQCLLVNGALGCNLLAIGFAFNIAQCCGMFPKSFVQIVNGRQLLLLRVLLFGIFFVLRDRRRRHCCRSWLVLIGTTGRFLKFVNRWLFVPFWIQWHCRGCLLVVKRAAALRRLHCRFRNAIVQRLHRFLLLLVLFHHIGLFGSRGRMNSTGSVLISIFCRYCGTLDIIERHSSGFRHFAVLLLLLLSVLLHRDLRFAFSGNMWRSTCESASSGMFGRISSFGGASVCSVMDNRSSEIGTGGSSVTMTAGGSSTKSCGGCGTSSALCLVQWTVKHQQTASRLGYHPPLPVCRSCQVAQWQPENQPLVLRHLQLSPSSSSSSE
uniref:Uncharacterized protein n=1 Tax=Anopheles atroparvus TaxID=41427 RepID=A0A182J8E4_ANOAO